MSYNGKRVRLKSPNPPSGATKRIVAALLGIVGLVVATVLTIIVATAASPATASDGQSGHVTWTGNGSENADPGCTNDQTANWHWILTPPGAATTLLSGTLHVTYQSGATTTTQGTFNNPNGQGAMHFYVSLTGDDVVTSASVDFTYTGSGGNFVLTISDSSCTEGTPTSSAPTSSAPTSSAPTSSAPTSSAPTSSAPTSGPTSGPTTGPTSGPTSGPTQRPPSHHPHHPAVPTNSGSPFPVPGTGGSLPPSTASSGSGWNVLLLGVALAATLAAVAAMVGAYRRPLLARHSRGKRR